MGKFLLRTIVLLVFVFSDNSCPPNRLRLLGCQKEEDLLMFLHPVQNEKFNAIVAGSYELCHQSVISLLRKDRQQVVYQQYQVVVNHLLPNPF